MIKSKESRLSDYIKNILPATITILLITSSATNFQSYGFSKFPPVFLVITIFYWGIYRPSSIPNWLVFFLGLFQDILYATPLGISPFLMLVFWFAVITQRRFLIKEPFLILWTMFGLSITMYIFLNWALSSIYVGNFTYSHTILMQLAFTFFFYPCMHLVFNAINQIGNR